MRSKENLFEKIKKEILEIHDYEICEISCIEIKEANKEFLNWIDKEII